MTASRARRRRVVVALLLAVPLVLAACSSSDGGTRQGGVPDASDTRDPWTTPIPESPVLDEDSDGIAAALSEEDGATALVYEYGVPIYEADADTPTVRVTCTEEDWGDCPVEDGPVPIPAEAVANSGSDGAMVVIDREAGRVYDFWQAERISEERWNASWGTYAPLADGQVEGGNGSTGAGINLLAGVVRTEEIRAGEIRHALAFASDLSCPDVFRYPAVKTDGHASSEPCVPQGARLQLDPSIDVAAIPGITPGEVAVARALQTYGGYVRDSAQTALAVAFEKPEEGDDVYLAAGFPWDFYDLPHIPWESLRVLQTWDGS